MDLAQQTLFYYPNTFEQNPGFLIKIHTLDEYTIIKIRNTFEFDNFAISIILSTFK